MLANWIPNSKSQSLKKSDGLQVNVLEWKDNSMKDLIELDLIKPSSISFNLNGRKPHLQYSNEQWSASWSCDILRQLSADQLHPPPEERGGHPLLRLPGGGWAWPARHSGHQPGHPQSRGCWGRTRMNKQNKILYFYITDGRHVSEGKRHSKGLPIQI